MAFYTELLSDYLENNELPNAFFQIPNFRDYFVAKFINREIGFETEELFKIKLDLRANIFIPLYANKITQLDNILNNIEDPTKQREITRNYGKIASKSWVLPFNSNVADPSSKGETDAYSNNDLEIEKGWTIEEIGKAIDIILNYKNSLINELLNKFEPLFMGIYGGVLC